MALSRRRLNRWPLAAILLTSVTFAFPEQAAAQFNPLGALFRPIFQPQHPRYYNDGPRSYSHRGRAPESTTAAPQDNNRALANLEPSTRTQTDVISRSISSQTVLGTVGSTDDLLQPGETSAADAQKDEQKRDYLSRISGLIQRFKAQMQKEQSHNEGDITEYAIQQAVDDSYKHSNLQRFETFIGENWSAEKLRVMILDRADHEVTPLLNGTNKGNIAMSDLRSMIQKSAEVVYSRLFEISELLAANRSSALFVQRLYQTHGDLMQGDIREGAERMLMRASSSVAANFSGLVRRDDNAYALAYRQKRILFDCLSENIERITSSEQGIAAPEEIASRIADVEKKECIGWIDQQFKGLDGKLKPQEPVPQRVVWTAEGPKDDPSMYSRPSGAM